MPDTNKSLLLQDLLAEFSSAPGTLRVDVLGDLAALPVNIGSTVDRTASGNITSTQAIEISTTACGSARLQVSGTWTGSLAFQYTVDGTTWHSLVMEPDGGGSASSATANGSWSVQVSAYQAVQVVGATVATGSAAVFWAASTATSTVVLGQPLPAGLAHVGSVTVDASVLPAGAATETTLAAVQSALGGILDADVQDRAARLLGVVYGSQGVQLQQTPTDHNTKVELATGATLYDARSIRPLTSSDQVTTVPSGTQTVAGTVTANIGTSGSLALDTTLTGGTVKVQLWDGVQVIGTTTHPVQVSLANTGANSTPLSVTMAAAADVSDRAGRLLGVIYGSQAAQLQQSATNYNLYTELRTSGTAYDARQVRALTSSDQVTTVPSGTQTVSGSVSVSNFPATQPVSVVALPLPAGAATAAKQPAFGTAGTSSVDVLSVQGAAGGTPLPISGTFWQSTQPVSGTFWQTVQPISAAALPLPSGAATALLQGTANTSLANLDVASSTLATKTLQGAGLPSSLTGSGNLKVAIQEALPAGTALLGSVNLGTTAGGAGQLALDASVTTMSAKLPAALVSGRLDVNVGASTSLTVSGPLTDAQLRAAAVPVSGTFYQATQPVSGTFWQATQPVSGAFWQTTQPVSIAAAIDVSDRAGRLLGVLYGSQAQQLQQSATNYNLYAELRTGGTAYDARQVRALTSADQVTIVPSGTQTVSGSVSVSNFPATQPVSVASLPLPSGAATAAKQPALGTAGTSSLDVLSVQGTAGGTPLPVSAIFWQTVQPTSAAQLPAALVSGRLDVNVGASTALTVSGTVAVVPALASAPGGVELSDGASFYTAAKTGQFPTALGITTKAASLSVALASDQVGTAGSGSATVLTIQGNASGTAVPVSGSVTTSGTATVTQGTAAAASAPWLMQLSDGASAYTGVKTAQIPTTLGATTKAASLSVALATDQVGAAGTAASNVLSVQGIAGMTALQVTPPAGIGQQTLANSISVGLNSSQVGTAGSGSTTVFTVQGNASGTPQPVSGTLTVTQGASAAVGAPWYARLSDGSSAYVGAKTGQLPLSTGMTTYGNALCVTRAGDTASTPITTNATTPVINGSGVLRRFMITTAGVTSAVTLYDSLVGSGTSLGVWSTTIQNSLELNVSFSVGLTAVTTGGTPAQLLFSTVLLG